MSDRYEKYIGFDQNELRYKLDRVIDKYSGNEVEKLVKRTPEEIEEYKRQKEAEFDNIVETWNRLGINKCLSNKGFKEDKFSKIYLKLIDNRLKELSNTNQTEDIETNLIKSIEDVNKKYNLKPALNYFSVRDNDHYLSTNRIFKDIRKSEIEKMFYRRISLEGAERLARNRLSKAESLNEGIATIQELQKTHNNRSIFFKIFHPIKNANENRLIKEIKTEVMQKFNITNEKLESKLKKEVNVSNLKTANLYKVNGFVDYYSYEKSGKIYSQQKINNDREDVAKRAEDDFIDTQMEYDKILSNESEKNVRESIIVEDAKNNEEIEISSEQVIDDPIIIKVPNNDKL